MTRPPSGYPPPTSAQLGDGGTLDLRALAAEVCSRYRREFPDEEERYGEAGIEWCLHDNQHILNWAVNECRGYGGFERQVAWLARVLEARSFPLERLARNLELAADLVEDALPPTARELREVLAAGARLVRSRPTFLEPSG